MNTKSASLFAIITVAACLLFGALGYTITTENKTQAEQKHAQSFPGMVYFEM